MIRKPIANLLILAIVLALFTVHGVPASAYDTVKPGQFQTFSAGTWHSAAIKEDGTLWTWGFNQDGQLGDGTTLTRYTPVKVLNDVVSVSAGDNTTFAIKSDGSLWVWGGNKAVGESSGWQRGSNGALGDGTTNDSLVPIKIMDNVNWVSSQNFAVKTDGSLWKWGGFTDGKNYTYHDFGERKFWSENSHQEIDTTLIGATNKPEKIMDDVVLIADSQILKTDGSLWKYRYNNAETVKMMDDVYAVSGNKVIMNDRNLWSWGSNEWGNVGDGTTIDRDIDNIVKVLDNVISVSDYDSHTAAVCEDGSMWTWGIGLLGDGTEESRLSPVKIGDNYSAVVQSWAHSLALRKDGSLWGWGRNNRGQLGIGELDGSDTPIKIMDGIKLPPVANKDNNAVTTELGNKISWTPETSDMGYWIYRSTEKGKLGGSITEKPVKGGNYVDVNVDSNTSYYYTIVKDGDTPDKTRFDVVELKTGEILSEDTDGTKNYILMQLGKDTMNVNGEVIDIDPGRGTSPIGLNGRTLVPIGAIINVMGGIAEWNGAEKKISISASGHDITMWVGRNDILVDGVTKEMDVEPQSKNERTLLPLKFVAENLDCLATWIGSTQEIIVLFYT